MDGSRAEQLVGSAEDTMQISGPFGLVSFGVSFGVWDRLRAQSEVQRILRPNGYSVRFCTHCCPSVSFQSRVSSLINEQSHECHYGTRHGNQVAVIREYRQGRSR